MRPPVKVDNVKADNAKVDNAKVDKPEREPWVYIFPATGVVMLIAMGLFAYSILDSRREGARVTASESPRTGGGMTVGQHEVLGRVYPPAYRDVSDAKTPRPPEFQNAIAQYSKRDYAAASASLAGIVEKHPGFVEARLYLGICYLAANNRPAGMAELRKVVDAGSTPYLEQARFYLAKGLIAANDFPAAREQLNDVIAIHGDLGQQAETLLTRISK